jgi:hypothetical protein
MPTPANADRDAFLAFLARATRKATRRPSPAAAARAYRAEIDALPAPLAHYYQGSIGYGMAGHVVDGTEVVLDGTEEPTRGRRPA